MTDGFWVLCFVVFSPLLGTVCGFWVCVFLPFFWKLSLRGISMDHCKLERRQQRGFVVVAATSVCRLV